MGMSQRPFIETGHCLSGLHCRLCRQREEGHPWRRALGAHWEMPPGYPEFECPHGKPWGWRPPDRGLGDTIERLLTTAGLDGSPKRFIERITGRPCGCAGRRDALNRAFPYRR